MNKIPNLPTAGVRRRRPCVQIVRGLPGAGKSTLARRAEKREARKVRKNELKARRGDGQHDSRKRRGRRR